MKVSKDVPHRAVAQVFENAEPRAWYPLVMIFALMTLGMFAGGTFSCRNLLIYLAPELQIVRQEMQAFQEEAQSSNEELQVRLGEMYHRSGREAGASRRESGRAETNYYVAQESSNQ
jgi:hypothetical protein